MTRTTNLPDFASLFQSLTGNPPLSWQERLFREHFEGKKELPGVIDLPTGLGKTMVMAIWLIARAQKLDVPTRLIYVVDRRTVVDQATDLAEEFAFLLADDLEEDKRMIERKPKLAERKIQFAQQLRELRQSLWPGKDRLAISTLRGQLADNREWSRDPSRPAIIIGTVDLIGSALLFSGYRSSYKRRPLEAGLLGQDALLVLDEAHLSKPFEKLLDSISDFQKSHGKPMQVIRMSATSGNPKEDGIFRLDTDPNSESFDLWSKQDDHGKEKNSIKTRFEAKKSLTIATISEKDNLKKKLVLVDAAIALAKKPEIVGKRIVVFVQQPEDAKAVAIAIREHVVESDDESGSKPKKIKNTPYKESVEVLTGTMRGVERDELVEKPVFKERWLNGDLKPDQPVNQAPVFLISTSAGEVGFDLNADHMVCDATTIDSFIQRLGRVNRRGLGDAEIHLLVEPPKKDKDGKAKDLAIGKTIDLLQNGMDLSPKKLAALKSGAWKDNYRAACSPEPLTADLTDILLDAWSMTSITGPMPGRPEVGPWLRGIDEWEPPQTTIAWRAELDLEGFPDLDLDDVEEWFDTHRILKHETYPFTGRF